MKYFIIFLLYCLGDRIDIHLIGTLSASDIFVVLYFVICLYFSDGCRKKFFQNKDLVVLSVAYAALLGCTILMEIIVGNTFNNAMRGIAVIVMSYAKLFFLWQMLGGHNERIGSYMICMIISYLFFMSPEEDVSAESILSGENFSFFKFMIAPRIGELLVVLSLIMREEKKIMASIFMVIGMACIALGARSTGLSIMLTGVLGLIVTMGYKMSSKVILKWSIPSAIVLYGIYVVYINAVLSGAIIGGNSHDQLSEVKNPYNPISVLFAGRTEMPASTAAIIDKPLTGHGAWATDPGWKYHMIQIGFAGKEFEKERILYATDIIPAHSVILGTGVNNGIFAMLIITFIICYIIRKGWISLSVRNPLLFLAIFSIVDLVWNAMFSPVPHFRNEFPFYFVCCLMSASPEVEKNFKRAKRRLLIKRVNNGAKNSVGRYRIVNGRLVRTTLKSSPQKQ